MEMHEIKYFWDEGKCRMCSNPAEQRQCISEGDVLI